MKITTETIKMVAAVVIAAFGTFFLMNSLHDPAGAARAGRLTGEITTYNLFKEKAEGQIATYTRRIEDSGGTDFTSIDRRETIRAERQEYMDEIATRIAELNEMGIIINAGVQ
jgi:hypothetical protein